MTTWLMRLLDSSLLVTSARFSPDVRLCDFPPQALSMNLPLKNTTLTLMIVAQLCLRIRQAGRTKSCQLLGTIYSRCQLQVERGAYHPRLAVQFSIGDGMLMSLLSLTPALSHVLEILARQTDGELTGAGPGPPDNHQSWFSKHVTTVEQSVRTGV